MVYTVTINLKQNSCLGSMQFLEKSPATATPHSDDDANNKLKSYVLSYFRLPVGFEKIIYGNCGDSKRSIADEDAAC